MASQTLCIDEFNFNEDYENVKFFFVSTTDYHRPGNPFKLVSVPGLSRVKMKFSLPHGISEPQCIQLTVTDGCWSGMVDVYFNGRPKVEGLEMDFHDNFKNRKIPLQLDELDCDEILRPNNKNNIVIKLRKDAAMDYWLSDAKIELLYNASSDEQALQLQDDAKRLRGRERKKEDARRPFGKPGEQFHYVEGNVLPNTEDKAFEHKALTQERPEKLPWKIMDKARTFICGILNRGGQGIIYFGIGDSYDQSTKYKRGVIIGLNIEGLRDEISKAFQSTLDDHIKSDYGKMTKGGDMNCVNIHFVPIWESEEPTSRYVVEIEVKREWMFCQDHVYYFQKWTEKRPNERGANNEKCGLHDLYKIDRNNWEDAVIRTQASSDSVKAIDAAKQVKEPLSLKYKEWQADKKNKAPKELHNTRENKEGGSKTTYRKGKAGHTSSPFNCQNLVFEYRPRKELDENIQKIQKGKIKVLHGTIGTGKTTAARNYIQMNKEKFDIRWRIDVSKGEEIIIKSLTYEADNLRVSYDKLFQTIKAKARKDIIFLLDNVEKKLFFESEWFSLLLGIRESVYIIITTNSNPSDFENLADVENFPVGNFDEALEFLKDGRTNESEKDLEDLCEQFDWNILGLTVAKEYMVQNKLPAGRYLKRLRNSVTARKYEGDAGHPALYHSIRLCLRDVYDDDTFAAIATTSFISNNMIPVFLLSNQLSSNEDENEARLDDIHNQLKSLVHITVVSDIRFFTYHPFTRHVIKDVIDEKKDADGEKKDGEGEKKDGDGEKTDEKKRLRKEDLVFNLARTFVRYISKDNRFPKGDFLQRAVREHAEIFIQEWKEQKDDRISIALARLSELVGFTDTQQQSLDVGERYFELARRLLHNLCEITEEDIHNSITDKDREMFGITDNDRKMFGIADKHLAVANQLFTKLAKKSSNLSICVIEELVFLRTVNEQDLAMFPEEVKETVKEKIRFSTPLSRSDVEVFVNHKVAYSVHAYRELFLPELYLSVIYSFGRNYFYRDRATLKHSSVYYIDLLKRAYCLSRAISEKMNQDEAVFHEYSVLSYGLLYLLVNDDDISEDGTHKKKERQAHVRDLRNVINRYRELICDDRRFFEMGMLKRTKDDTYGELKCYLQIVKCYKTLLSLTADEDHKQCIINGVEACEHILKILQAYGALEHLVQYSKHMNAIAEFYSSTNQEEHNLKAIEIFKLSAKQAETYDDDVTTMFYLKALVGLADGLRRNGEYNRSMCYLVRCDSKESLLELKRQNPHIQKRIDNIRKHVMSRLDEATTSRNFDDTDPCQVDSSSSDSSRNGRDPTFCYPMERPCGFALIINIKSFKSTTDNGVTLDERRGSDVDVKKLEKLWKQFGFTVETHDEDLKAHRICKVVHDMASKIKSVQRCFVCCIMTHGDMGVIYGSDSKPVEIKYITDLFTEDKCEALAGKPKLFFIQACRGSQGRPPAMPEITQTPALDANALSEADGDVDYDHVNDLTFRHSADPRESDFLIGYSTVADHASFRDIKNGTWYVGALVEIFSKYHTDKDVMWMMIRVNSKVNERYKEMGYRQCPAPISTLTKDIYFSSIA